ncbi:MAG: VanZ family protein [Clostridia bacterium]|jgi:VanZ family protein
MDRKNKIIRWGMLILWMGVIFFFSSQTGMESSRNNALILRILSGMGIDLQWMDSWVNMNLVIRKLAHIIGYFILATLWIRALEDEGRSRARTLLWAGIFSFLYACTDEWHQSFVPQRDPSFRDVLIDSVGICLAILIRLRPFLWRGLGERSEKMVKD